MMIAIALKVVCCFDYVHSGKLLTQQLVFSYIHLVKFYADPCTNRNVFLPSFHSSEMEGKLFGFNYFYSGRYLLHARFFVTVLFFEKRRLF